MKGDSKFLRIALNGRPASAKDFCAEESHGGGNTTAVGNQLLKRCVAVALRVHQHSPDNLGEEVAVEVPAFHHLAEFLGKFCVVILLEGLQPRIQDPLLFGRGEFRVIGDVVDMPAEIME